MESSSTLGGQLVGHLVDPNTSYPSTCERQFVKDDPNVKFATMVASLARSFDPCALFNNNSFLSNPLSVGLACKYCLYNIDCLKT